MGFRFSRRIGILPGLCLNLSGSGVSLSAGVRGAHVPLGPRGAYTSVGLPGTGISYRQRIGGSQRLPPGSTYAGIRFERHRQSGQRRTGAETVPGGASKRFR